MNEFRCSPLRHSSDGTAHTIGIHSRIYIAPLRVPYYSEAAVVFTLTCQYHQPSSEEKRRREEIGEECGSLKYGLLIDFKWKHISKIVFFTTCILEPENVWW